MIFMAKLLSVCSLCSGSAYLPLGNICILMERAGDD